MEAFLHSYEVFGLFCFLRLLFARPHLAMPLQDDLPTYLPTLLSRLGFVKASRLMGYLITHCTALVTLNPRCFSSCYPCYAVLSSVLYSAELGGKSFTLLRASLGLAVILNTTAKVTSKPTVDQSENRYSVISPTELDTAFLS